MNASSPALALALAEVSRLEKHVREFEQSRDLQRLSIGRVLSKTDARLMVVRKALAVALVEASRLARDAGLPEVALELVRQYAEQEHLAETMAQRPGC